MSIRKKISTLVIAGLCAGFLIISAGQAWAADSPDLKQELKIPPEDRTQILTLKDGSTLIGRISAVGASEISFQTKLGELKIPVESIRKIREVPASTIRNGQYWFPNPNATRLYFGPTARLLKRGEGYFADYELFFPALTVGVTDRVTLGGGMSIFPGAGLDRQLFYLTPKVGIKSYGNLHWAAGTLVLKIPDVSQVVGVLYSLGTFGTPDGSISAGLGYGFVGRHLADKPMIMIGGEKRLTRRLAFVTENWVVPGGEAPVVSYGIRLMGEDLSVDLAFFNILDEDAVFPGIPYIDLVFKF